MAYTPYLIADFKTGKDIGKEPWLVPNDAFDVLLNARINKGVLEKRQGYGTAIASTGNSNAIMGFGQHLYNAQPSILVADTKRMYRLDIFKETLTDLSGSDTFNGTDKDFFWFCNYYGTTYITNNYDPIYTWNEGTETLAALETGDTTITTCQMIFRYKGRLVLIDVVETTNEWNPMRCRYTDVNGTTFPALNYVDAQTDEQAISGCYLAKDDSIVVFCPNSIWRLRYTRDSDNPLTWDNITDSYGSIAYHLAIAHSDGIVTMGQRGLIFYDGYRAQPMDVPLLRDLIDMMNLKKLYLCQGIREKVYDRLLITYPKSGSSYCDRMLEYNVLENNWCQHDIAAHSLYAFDGHIGTLMGDDLDEYYSADGAYGDTITITERLLLRLAEGSLTLFGDRTGNVFVHESDTDDNSNNIELDIRTKRLNPFLSEGRRAHLRSVDILVDTDSDASFTASIYKDQSTTAYRSATVTCSGNGGKHWETFWADSEQGEFFKFRISHTDKDNRPRIHALRFWFDKAGDSYLS